GAPRRVALRGVAASPAPDRAAAYQPVPQPCKEQFACGGNRLSRPGLDRQHHDEPDRPGDRGRRHHHGGVSQHQPVDLRVHELVQPALRAEGRAAVSSIRRWLRTNLFSSWPSSLATLAILWLAWRLVPPFADWAVLQAVWHAPDARACREAHGACWAFIGEKHRFILFGTYPYEEHWRPALATAILIFLWVFSAFRVFWKWWLSAVWLAGLSLIAMLMWGGILGLAYVENGRWGGLILTLILASFGAALAFPLAILLALGRRSSLPVVRAMCVAYI